MLIKHYSPQTNKTLNNDELCTGCYQCTKSKYKNISYNTTPLTIFDNLSIKQLNDIIETQLTETKKIAHIHLKYAFLNQKTYESTIEQYNHLIFMNKHAYEKDIVVDYILKQQNHSNTFIINTQNTPTQPTSSTQSNTVYVSKEAIRNIT